MSRPCCWPVIMATCNETQRCDPVSQALMNCIGAERANLAPICQEILDRMNTNNLGVNFLYCMKTGSGVCLTEMLPDTSGTASTGDSRWAKIFRRVPCLPLSRCNVGGEIQCWSSGDINRIEL